MVVTIADRYGARRHWHESCYDADRQSRAARMATPPEEAVPRKANGEPWAPLDDYEAARALLSRLGPEASERLLRQSYEQHGTEISAVQGVVLAAQIARREASGESGYR